MILATDKASPVFNKVGQNITKLNLPLNTMTDAVNKSQAGLKGWQNPVDVVNSKFSKANTKVVSLDKAVKNTTKSVGNMVKNASRFDARLLSVLFAGMALRRVFGGMLRSITDTFFKAEDNTSGLAKATVRLNAGWEFLKFSIFDALNTDFFIGFIDGIVRAINFISQLPRGVKIAILAIITALAALGTGALVYASIKLAWNAIFGIGGLLALKATETTASVAAVETSLTSLKATTSAIKFSGLIGALGGIALAAGIAFAAIKLGKAISDQFLEVGAPSVEDIALGSIDNLDVLQSSVDGTTQEFSNLSGGMDSTIQIINNLDGVTGELTSTIGTQDDVTKGIVKTGENWLESQQNEINITPDLQASINSITSAVLAQAEAFRELATAKGEAGGTDFLEDFEESSPVSE